MNENEVKFLIIRFSSIGDIVLTTPIIRTIKLNIEGAKIHYLIKKQYRCLLETNPYIDKIHNLETNKQTTQELINESFDYVIDLQKNIRSWKIKNKLRVLDFSFPKLNLKKWIYVNFKINQLPNIHIVDRYFEAVKLFDIHNDNKGLDFFLADSDSVNIKDLNIKDNFIAYAIGSQHNTKKMPNHKIIELCNKVKGQIILIGSLEDDYNAQEITTHCNNTINLCGKLSIRQSAFLIKTSSLVIAHDTGMMHIAAAFKKIIFSIWGNTSPNFGMYPYMSDDKSIIFEVNNLKCRPCSKLGFKKCHKQHFNCMEKQDINTIAERINNIIN